jgi:hypothetical protein
MDWKKCRLQGRTTESKYGSGVILPNGARTANIAKDSLAQRANAEMRRWLSKLPPRHRAAVRFASPTPVSIGTSSSPSRSHLIPRRKRYD